MQYIDKSIRENEGKQIVNSLLNDCWNDNGYVGADYDTLCKPVYKKPFIDLLLDEQSKFCCYCMRELDKTTLEHIIPQSASIQEFDKYISEILTNNVIHKDNFDKSNHVIPPAKYPHDIAYHNLIVSCDGNSHCNHHRGDNFIKTLFYDIEICQKVEYDSKGNAFSVEYFDDLETIGISTNPLLIIYRKILCEFAKIKESIEEISDDDILEIVATISLEDKYQNTLNNFWDSPSKRPDLLKYRWFFNYYKNKHNN